MDIFIISFLIILHITMENNSNGVKTFQKKAYDDLENVFIVTYRDRASQKEVFINHMSQILKDYKYMILFVHQVDKRPFNKGALMNIGFKFIKDTFPHKYHDINFTFHDIDVMPGFSKQIKYKTEYNVVEHHYGYKHCIGGIYTFKGLDYEKINGTPNFWGWGWEDNAVQFRLEHEKIKVAKNYFFDKTDKNTIKNFLEINTGDIRSYNFEGIEKILIDIKKNKSKKFGIDTLSNINYTTEKIKDKILMLHVSTFDTILSIPTKLHNVKPPSTFKKERQRLSREKKIEQEKINAKKNNGSAKLFNMRIFQN